MPNPRLADYQIDEIVAFMMSLKAGTRSKKRERERGDRD